MKTPRKTDPAALRRAAEAHLRGKSATSSQMTYDEMLRLHHELEVHQIELEMQNDELRAAQAEIEAGLERYTDLFDFAPVGYFNLTADGTIQLANLTGAKLVQVERGQLVGRRFGALVAEADRPVFNRCLDAVFSTKNKQECELALEVAGGLSLTVLFEASLAPDGRECRAVLSDITGIVMARREIAELLAQTKLDANTKAELLREVNHRVTNNLTAILGLMSFESSHLPKDDPRPVTTLMDHLDRRIRSMAAVHRMLSKSSWAPIPAVGLAEKIFEEALKTAPSEHTPEIAIQPSALLVSPRQAGTLALVLNELVHNTVKYAGQPAGGVCIGFQVNCDQGEITMRYRDNGPGYPPDILVAKGTTNGLELIKNLMSGSLSGSVTLANDNGAVATLRFRQEEADRT